VVGRQNADTADTLHLRDVAMATVFGFLCMGCTLAPSGEYDLTVHVWRQCGLKSNYFDHLLCLCFSSCTLSKLVMTPYAYVNYITDLCVPL